MAEKGGYRHFMLKEIYEQPRAITDTLRGRVAPETRQRGPARREPRPATVRRPSSGWSSSPAAPRTTPPCSAASMIEQLAGIPPRSTSARSSATATRIIGPGDPGGRHLPVGRDRRHARRGQGGAAARAARSSPSPTWSARRWPARRPASLYTHAGPEIGVASTKAFTTHDRGDLPARPLARPAARRAHRRGREQAHPGPGGAPAAHREDARARRRRSRRWPASCQRAPELPLPRARRSTSRSRWRARSS